MMTLNETFMKHFVMQRVGNRNQGQSQVPALRVSDAGGKPVSRYKILPSADTVQQDIGVGAKPASLHNNR